MRAQGCLSVHEDALDERTRVVAPSGPVDASSAPRLGRRLLALVDAGARALVIDLSRVSFMDSTGIGVLLNALRRMTQRNGLLLLIAPAEHLRRPFEVTGLARRFRLFDSRADALAVVAGASA
jgi:anti-sigma B factor antagonist